VPLTQVQTRSISWLERPLWQRSAFQLVAGIKGSGKGTYLAGLAARITNDGANALFVSSEDSTEIDLKPRLVAAGAVIERCFTITQHLRLPNDVADLEALALRLGGVGLFVIDPVANHIGAAKPNDDVEVRHAIAPLNGLADRLDCLLIGVRHPGKDRSRGAVASILGSTAWVDTPRAVVFIAVDDEDPAVRLGHLVATARPERAALIGLVAVDPGASGEERGERERDRCAAATLADESVVVAVLARSGESLREKPDVLVHGPGYFCCGIHPRLRLGMPLGATLHPASRTRVLPP
jgi:hypothetical protein